MTDLSIILKRLSALSQETRLIAFRVLMEAGADGLNAGTIARRLTLPPNRLSGHLTILVNSGLVSVEKDGRHLIYRAQIGAVNELLSSLVETCCHGHPDVCAPLSDLAAPRH